MVAIIGNYVTNTFFMLVILAIVLVRSCTYIKKGTSRWYCLGLILATAFYVVMDAMFIVCDLDDAVAASTFQHAVFVFYIAYVVLPFMWHLFVRNFVGSTFKPITRTLELIPIVALLALVIMSAFNGCLWTIDDTKTYIRGPLFDVYTYLNFFYYVEPLVYAVVVLLRRQQKQEPYLLRAMLISLVPIFAATINNFVIPVYEIFPFQPFCSVLVVLISYFSMASKQNDELQLEQQQVIEDALVNAREAEAVAVEANNVKSSFLSNMSHDIRTPMNAIINLTDLARKEDDIEVVREYLDKMATSGQFLLTLINDILDMSRIESGELELKKENLTRTEFLHTVNTVIAPLIEAKHLHYHAEMNPGEYTISVDKMRFNQIFFNLLSNAVKFTPEGGDVWFTVDNIEAENGKLQVLFTVRDNGIGMSEEFQTRLFEPFAREHSQLNSKATGTGLGLAIVKSLVEAMGGTITVESKLGKGSEFKVMFYVDIVARRELTEEEMGETAEEAVPSLDGLQILLVEDNEINTYVATILLEKAGCVVTTAENGQVALDTFQASAPFAFDAIFMDVRMPIMDGLEATRAIRALDRPDSASIPIIAMTADAFVEEQKRTIESGMNYHLSKPVDAKDIYKTLEECTRRGTRSTTAG